MIAEYATSHWVQNLRVHPQVQVRVAEKRFAARARLVSPESELYRIVQEMSREKYGWGEGLVVELVPELTSG